MQTLEHVDDPKKVIANMYDKLKSGGTLLLTVPDGLRINHASHVWTFSADSLENALRDLGFVDISITTVNEGRNLFCVASKRKLVSVVVPVLCPSEAVLSTMKACFESIRAAVDDVRGELIVVDDNSAVGSTYFADISDVYVRNSKTTGVSTSLNRGFKIAQGDFLVKLDSDYLVPKNLFNTLLDDWTDDLAFIAPSYVLGRANNPEHLSVDNIPTPEGGVIEKPTGSSDKTEYAWGGGIMMFDAEKLKEVEYFDEAFDVGSAQDNDVIYRILMKGHNWRWTNNVLTRHFASISSTDPNAPDSRGERRRIGKEIFMNKHGFVPGGFIANVKKHFNYER